MNKSLMALLDPITNDAVCATMWVSPGILPELIIWLLLDVFLLYRIAFMYVIW